jgi:thioredoxin reductase
MMLPAMTRVLDPRSVAGRAPAVERRVPLVVVGAGPAGVAAATEAARAGVEVLLLDEHPLDVDTMAMDVPLFFGQRMGAAVRDRGAMLERVVRSNPGLEAAVDAGVDVQLGVAVWGAFRPSAAVREADGPFLGVADGARSWLVGYERLVVAAGARDIAIGFRGWEKAGVMGARAAGVLLARYRALAARRLVILGSGPLGLETAALALDAGVEVAAVVDVAPAVRGDAGERARLERAGVRFHPGHVVQEACGGRDEVEGVALVPVGGGPGAEIACDTVCLAIGLAPAVELPAVLGCRLVFRADRGGWVPETDGSGLTSLAEVSVAGDCAGVPSDVADWRAWLRASLAADGGDAYACLCEEVTRRELIGVQPPRYLGGRSEAMRARSLDTLRRDGPVDPDQVKRLTRAGMGPCQARRCREQVALLLAESAGAGAAELPVPSYRPPVRPLPLSVLWPHDEPEAMREHWVSWFGIPSQFAPHWDGQVAEAPAAGLDD